MQSELDRNGTGPEGTDREGAADTARLALFGHSHVNCLIASLEAAPRPGVVSRALRLRPRDKQLRRQTPGIETEGLREATLGDLCRMIARLGGYPPRIAPHKIPGIAKAEGVVTVLSIRGIQHVFRGLAETDPPYDFVLPSEPDLPLEPDTVLLPSGLIEDYYRRVFAGSLDHISMIHDRVRHNLCHIEMPPPYGDNDWLVGRLGAKIEDDRGEALALSRPLLRYKLWRVASGIYRTHCESLGVTWIPVPPDLTVADPGGGRFLHPDGWHEDGIHANTAYGARMVDEILAAMPGPNRPN